MICPNCGSLKSSVTDSRVSTRANCTSSRWRRRICDSCETKFTTYEVSSTVLEDLEKLVKDLRVTANLATLAADSIESIDRV